MASVRESDTHLAIQSPFGLVLGSGRANLLLDESSELTEIAMLLVAPEVLEKKLNRAEHGGWKLKPKRHSTSSPSVFGELLQLQVGHSFYEAASAVLAYSTTLCRNSSRDDGVQCTSSGPLSFEEGCCIDCGTLEVYCERCPPCLGVYLAERQRQTQECD